MARKALGCNTRVFAVMRAQMWTPLAGGVRLESRTRAAKARERWCSRSRVWAGKSRLAL